MAQALGWPNKPIGWADIAKLSTNPQGWAAYGHPEFGAFKFGHTHPDYSNSGLDAIIAMNYAAVGKVRGLTSDDVNSTAVQTFLTSVENSVIHYGDSTGFFADKMFNKGPSYLSAAVMYESLVVEANLGKTYPNLAYPVVAIYPKEGTFYSDHPYAILQGRLDDARENGGGPGVSQLLAGQTPAIESSAIRVSPLQSQRCHRRTHRQRARGRSRPAADAVADSFD